MAHYCVFESLNDSDDLISVSTHGNKANRRHNCVAVEITNNHSRHSRLIFRKCLLVERTPSSALYLCFSLLAVVDLGKFCFGCNGGQTVSECFCERKAEEYHTLSRGSQLCGA